METEKKRMEPVGVGVFFSPLIFFSEVVGGAVQDSDKDVFAWQ